MVDTKAKQKNWESFILQIEVFSNIAYRIMWKKTHLRLMHTDV